MSADSKSYNETKCFQRRRVPLSPLGLSHLIPAQIPLQMNKSLGMGKFGRVYRAKVKQSSKNKTVALKVLSKVRKDILYFSY